VGGGNARLDQHPFSHGVLPLQLTRNQLLLYNFTY
jgi:hypothetical protein